MSAPSIRLGELVGIAKGHKADGVLAQQEEGALRYLQINDLRREGEPRYTVDRRGTICSPDDVLIAWDGANAGTVGYGLEGVIGSTLARLRPGSSKVFTPYLGRFLQSRFAFLNDGTTGATIPHIDRTRLTSLKVPLPPIPEQRDIAAILDKAEGLRGKRRTALVQLDVLTRSVFLDLFGDLATNSKGWETKPLRKLVSEFRYGTSNKSQAQGKPALRIPNVIGGVIDVSDLKSVPVNPAEFERLRLMDGDVLFVRTNGNPDFVGRCAVFDHSVGARSGLPRDDFIFASCLIRARLRVDQITPIFLREFMLGTQGRRELRSRSKTSAGQFNINTENLGAIPVPLPPLSLQREFAQRVGAVDKLKATHRTSLAEMGALFSALQQRAFQGGL